MARFLKVIVLKTNLIKRLNRIQDIDVSTITDMYPFVEGEIRTLVITTEGSFYIKETILELVNQMPQFVIGKVADVSSRIDVDFNPEVGIQLDLDTWYKLYTQTGALPILIADGSVIGKGAHIPFVTNGTPPTITGATQHPSNTTTASTTAGDTDEYVFWKTSTGIYYAINNLGQ